jgi:hypothetical protein
MECWQLAIIKTRYKMVQVFQTPQNKSNRINKRRKKGTKEREAVKVINGRMELKEKITVKKVVIQRRIATEMCHVISTFTVIPETST